MFALNGAGSKIYLSKCAEHWNRVKSTSCRAVISPWKSSKESSYCFHTELRCAVKIIRFIIQPSDVSVLRAWKLLRGNKFCTTLVLCLVGKEWYAEIDEIGGARMIRCRGSVKNRTKKPRLLSFLTGLQISQKRWKAAEPVITHIELFILPAFENVDRSRHKAN